MKLINVIASVALLSCGVESAVALTFGVAFNGNLVVTPPECTLNNNNKERVHFGDILLTRIDGNQYKRPVPFTFTCENLAKEGLRLTLQGEATIFNSNGAVKTSNDKLGVVFYVNGTRQGINQPFNVNYNAVPTFEAAPVKNSVASYLDTDGGYFTALATLKVDYQ